MRVYVCVYVYVIMPIHVYLTRTLFVCLDALCEFIDNSISAIRAQPNAGKIEINIYEQKDGKVRNQILVEIKLLLCFIHYTIRIAL